jgi:hypothetical protein
MALTPWRANTRLRRAFAGAFLSSAATAMAAVWPPAAAQFLLTGKERDRWAVMAAMKLADRPGVPSGARRPRARSTTSPDRLHHEFGTLADLPPPTSTAMPGRLPPASARRERYRGARRADLARAPLFAAAFALSRLLEDRRRVAFEPVAAESLAALARRGRRLLFACTCALRFPARRGIHLSAARGHAVALRRELRTACEAGALAVASARLAQVRVREVGRMLARRAARVRRRGGPGLRGSGPLQ